MTKSLIKFEDKAVEKRERYKLPDIDRIKSKLIPAGVKILRSQFMNILIHTGINKKLPQQWKYLLLCVRACVGACMNCMH
jgi:hypothetical protein